MGNGLVPMIAKVTEDLIGQLEHFVGVENIPDNYKEMTDTINEGITDLKLFCYDTSGLEKRYNLAKKKIMLIN